MQQTKLNKPLQESMYQEEDSYINPSNVSKVNNSDYVEENKNLDSFVQDKAEVHINKAPVNVNNPYSSGQKKRGAKHS